MKQVLEALKLTQFRLPQSEIPSKPALIVLDKVIRDAERASEVGWDRKLEDEWQVVSSAYECDGIEEESKRSLMKSKNRVGDNTDP